MVLTHQRGRGNKVHLLLDNEYAVTTDINFWTEHYISDGTEIDEIQWHELLCEINYKKALNKCGDLLSRRDHSVKELKDKLLRTVDENSAQRAINRYIDAGYLDDRRFCKSLVEYLFKVKKFSLNHVKQECYKRGLSSEIINETLEEYDVDPVETIIELLQSKYANKFEKEDGLQKVMASLARKGFSYSEIKIAISRLENDEL